MFIRLTIIALAMIHSPIFEGSIAAQDNGSIDFNRDVRPIFKQHCAACHGGVKQAAELSFVYAMLAEWCREPIDMLVLAKLNQEGLTPANDELPERWLRRVSLDLVGLPPPSELRERFLAELPDGEIAYRNAVDTLLASAAFGERWASVWFDQVRYADSRGYGEDSPRSVWKYRDWVIDALNRDMPYDEFTVKQIAGDLLPDPRLDDHVATAVHRLTQTNEEGGTDDEEFRTMAILDRVSTTWQTWQGVTFGCVQCHDHPYDPFEHRDYYRFAAFFNNTADCDLDDDWPLIDVPLDSNEYDRAGSLDREAKSLTESLWQKRYTAVSDAQSLAKLMSSASTDRFHQLWSGFVRATCREPRKDEILRLLKLYDDIASKSDAEVAMESVASVLLNMDEVLTK